MLQPTFTVTEEVTDINYSKCVIEPLEKGYGHTLGVSLRRVLLSSIEGAAVTKIRLDGVQHQFTTLSGMKEDVVEFVLNLKQLQVRLENTTDSDIIVNLDVKGPKTVTAKDLALPATVILGNPDHVLAVLTDKTKLKAEITLSRGTGYLLAADQPTGVLGDIPVDASFSPINKVAYKVESTRVGRRTDYDRLILEMWTNGTITAKKVLEDAAKILVAHFKQVYEPVIVETPKETSLEDRIEDEVFKLTVEELDLPTRIANALRKGGYKTVKDLTQANMTDVAKVKNLGEKSVSSVAEALVKKGLQFKANS